MAYCGCRFNPDLGWLYQSLGRDGRSEEERNNLQARPLPSCGKWSHVLCEMFVSPPLFSISVCVSSISPHQLSLLSSGSRFPWQLLVGPTVIHSLLSLPLHSPFDARLVSISLLRCYLLAESLLLVACPNFLLSVLSCRIMISFDPVSFSLPLCVLVNPSIPLSPPPSCVDACGGGDKYHVVYIETVLSKFQSESTW